MTQQLNITGFTIDAADGRYWNADETLGLVQNDDGTWTLLDVDGYPSNHTLQADEAEYILRRCADAGADASEAMRRWDAYASSR